MTSEDRIVQLHLAIFDEGPGFKHWALWLEDDFNDADGTRHDNSFIVNARGFSTHFRFEHEKTNARDNERLFKLILVARLCRSVIRDFKTAAEGVEIKNQDLAWSCQNYVLDLVQRLRDGRLIEVTQERYEKMWLMQEGLVPAS